MSILRAGAPRVREPELMDDPGLEDERHFAALRGLESLNRISGSTRVVWKPIVRLARDLGVDRLRVLDIATGGGDVPIGLWRKAKRTKLKLDVVGVDVSSRAIDFARHQAQRCGAEVEFKKLDVLADSLPAGFDVVACSLFLHHLSDQQVVGLLRKMSQAAGRLLLVNDLVRGTANLMLVRFGAWLLTRSDVVRFDGPASVKAAFTIGEMRRLVDRAGMSNAKVSGRWPCRMLLECKYK